VTDMGGYSTPRLVCLAPWPCLGLIDCPPWHTPVFCVCACVKCEQTAFSCHPYPRRATPMRHHPGAAVRDAWVTRLNAHAVDSSLLVHLVHTSVLVLLWTQRLPPKTRLSYVCVRVSNVNKRHFRAVRTIATRTRRATPMRHHRSCVVASDSSLPSLPPVIRLGTQHPTRVSRHQGEMPCTSVDIVCLAPGHAHTSFVATHPLFHCPRDGCPSSLPSLRTAPQ
jgi:hypothetical protein